MPFKCCVPNCRGNYGSGPKVSVYSFPTNSDERDKWLRAIKREDGFKATTHTRVCEYHFTEDQLIRISQAYDQKKGKMVTAPLSKPRLAPGACPSILLPECQARSSSRFRKPSNSRPSRVDQQQDLEQSTPSDAFQNGKMDVIQEEKEESDEKLPEARNEVRSLESLGNSAQMSTGDGCDPKFETAVTNLCGQPALHHDNKILLTTEVKNTIKDENLIKVYRLSEPGLCQVVLTNRNDLEVSLACEELLSHQDPCTNAAMALGNQYSSVSISCQPGGSRSQVHEPCSHLANDPINDSSRRTLYRCAVCFRIEASMELLLRHQKTAHHGEPEQPPPQPEKPKLPKLMKSNCNSCCSSHILGRYSCKNCPFSSSCPFSLEKHMQEAHDSQQIYHCPVCSIQLRYYTAMERHLFEKHGQDTDEDKAPKQNEQKKKVNQDESGKEKPMVIEDSDESDGPTSKTTPSVETMADSYDFDACIARASLTLKLAHEPLLCAFCGGRFRTQERFCLHVISQHLTSPSTFQCCKCEMTFTHESHLRNHYRVSNGHQDLLPVFLKATFVDKRRGDGYVVGPDEHVKSLVQRTQESFLYTLDIMTRRDILEEPIVTKVFRRARLQPHLVEQERKMMKLVVTCVICGHGPCLKADMIQHLVMHTQHWPYLCPGCEQWFKYKPHALEHAKTCKENTLSASTSRVIMKMDDLRKQNEQIVALLVGHCSLGQNLPRFPGNNEEDYRAFYTVSEFWCDACKHNTSQFDDMVEHMSDHISDVLPYQCSQCQEYFASRRLTNTHIQKMKCGGVLIVDTKTEVTARDVATRKAREMVTLVEFRPQNAKIGSPLPQLLRKPDPPSKVQAEPPTSSSVVTATSLPAGLPATSPIANPADMTATMTTVSIPPAVTNIDSVNNAITTTELLQQVTLPVMNPAVPPNSLIKCKECGATYIQFSAFKLHATLHFPYTPWTCAKCYQSFRVYSGDNGFFQHVKTYHPDVDPPCCKMVNIEAFREQEDAIRTLWTRVQKPSPAPIESTNLVSGEVDSQTSESVKDILSKKINKRKQSMDTFMYTDNGDQDVKLSRYDNNGSLPVSVSPASGNAWHPSSTRKPTSRTKAANNKGPKLGAKYGTVDQVKIFKMAIATFVCPQCQDFDGVWSDLLIHYEAMHSDMAVCTQCDDSPCFHIVDYYKHMTQNHKGFRVSDCSTRRTDSKILGRDLIEQLGSLSRDKYGTMPATSFITCELITVKLTPEGGMSAARFVCRQCLHTARSSESFFIHIAEHLKIGEFHCLHCPFEGGIEAVRVHYRDSHHIRTPDMLPFSLQNKRFKALVARLMHALEDDEPDQPKETTSDKPATASTVRIKQEPKDDFYGDVPRVGACMKMEVDLPTPAPQLWTFSFACPYCRYQESGHKPSHYREHVELDHPRKQPAISINIRIALPEQDAQAIVESIVITKDTLKDARKKINKTYRIDSDQPVAKTLPLPEGYELRHIDTPAFLHPYNQQMMELYNHFSILEVVAVTGSTLSCHLCDVNQETFPALFEHWNRQHLSVEPYFCVFCGATGKRPTTIVSHERRAHPKDCGNKYGINEQYFEGLFYELQSMLKEWLSLNNVDSYVPEDIKLCLEPVVRMDDVSKDPKFALYFPRPPSVTSSKSGRSLRSRDT